MLTLACQNLTPSFRDFFASFYYNNTYVPPVDFSSQGVSKHLLDTENPEVAATAQRLISTPEVRQILSSPLSYDLEHQVPENNRILEKHGFKLLSSKPNLKELGKLVPFYSVVEHGELPGWIIKAGATRIPEDQMVLGPMNDRNEMAFFTREESLLRIEMVNRIAKVAQEAHIDVVLPQKKLVTYDPPATGEELTRKYCVVCKKLDILSPEDTVKAITSMGAEKQRETARKIVTLIRNAGLVDTSFHNIRLTPEGKIAIIDTEPVGMMVVKKTGLWNRLFGNRGSSVEKCARIGLYMLMNEATVMGRHPPTGFFINLSDSERAEPGLTVFHEEVKSEYNKAARPALSKWKIALSIISLGCIPAIIAIASLVLKNQTKRIFDNLNAIDRAFSLEMSSSTFVSLSETAKKQKIVAYGKKRKPLAMKFFSCIEGVPYKAGVFA